MKSNNNCSYDYNKSPQNYLLTSAQQQLQLSWPAMREPYIILMIAYRANSAVWQRHSLDLVKPILTIPIKLISGYSCNKH